MDDSRIVDLFLSKNESAISETAQKYGTRLRRIADQILHERSRGILRSICAGSAAAISEVLCFVS